MPIGQSHSDFSNHTIFFHRATSRNLRESIPTPKIKGFGRKGEYSLIQISIPTDSYVLVCCRLNSNRVRVERHKIQIGSAALNQAAGVKEKQGDSTSLLAGTGYRFRFLGRGFQINHHLPGWGGEVR